MHVGHLNAARFTPVLGHLPVLDHPAAYEQNSPSGDITAKSLLDVIVLFKAGISQIVLEYRESGLWWQPQLTTAAFVPFNSDFDATILLTLFQGPHPDRKGCVFDPRPVRRGRRTTARSFRGLINETGG